MNVNHINLKNGLKVCFIQDKSFNTVTIHLKGKAGSNLENKLQVGSAHILEHFYVSSNYGNKITSNGGKIIGVTSRDDVLFMIKIPKENVIDGLEFLSKVFTKEAINLDDFNKLKQISLQEIKRIKNSPERILGRFSCAASFPKDRMSILNIGGERNLNNLRIKDVLDFRDLYYHPNNFTLVLSGNVTIRNVAPYIKKLFGDYQAGNVAKHLEHKTLSKLAVKSYKFKGTSQIAVKIDFYGFRTSDNKKYSSFIISNTLDMLLNKLIKEQLRATYTIRCVSFSSGSYGLFSIYFLCEKKDLNIILGEIKRNTINFSSLISLRSIESSKRRVLSNLSFEMEKVSVRAEYYSDLLSHGRKDQNYKYEINMISKCCLSDIKNISKEIFSQNPKITIVGENINENEVKDIWIKS